MKIFKKTNFDKFDFILISLLMFFCIPLFVIYIDSPVNSLLLLFLIAFVGVYLCGKTAETLNDNNLIFLKRFWIVKIFLTVILLFLGWIPELDPSSLAWGFDPQRYYLYAQQLIQNNWEFDFVTLTYGGVVYYYAFIFYLFGINPINPALINCIVTLSATLLLIRAAYRVAGNPDHRFWTISLLLLVPECLWYDIMTAREMLISSLLIFAIISSGSYILKIHGTKLSNAILLFTISVISIAAIRTSMLMPLFGSIVMLYLVTNKVKMNSMDLLKKLLFTLVFITIFIAIMEIFDFDILGNFDIIFSSKNNIATSDEFANEWSENSIGKLLLPDNFIQSLLFLPFRMMLYLIAPLPNVLPNIEDLINGSREAWQLLLTSPSSILNILFFPYALASLARSMKYKNTDPSLLLIHVPYWITFIAISGGNLIIHERYRVMATTLLFTCVWLGYVKCTKNEVFLAYKYWIIMLTTGLFFYSIFKFLR